MKSFLALVVAFFSLNALANYTMFAAPVSVTVTATSTLVLAAKSNRSYLLIQNTGSADIYVRFGAVQTGTEGVKIVAGGAYEPVVAPGNSIYAVTATGTSTVTIQYGVQ